MARTYTILGACVVGAALWAQPYLFYNQGALVYVQANALVYVQGGMQINDVVQGANTFDGVVENLGEIRLVNNVAAGWRGHLLIGQNAELNSRPNSIIYVAGDYHNDQGSHRSVGTHNAYGNTTLGGTLEFNGGDGPQTFRITMPAAENNDQRWRLHTVRINNTTAGVANRYVEIVNGTDRDMWIGTPTEGQLILASGRIHTVDATGANNFLSNNNPVEVRVFRTDVNAIDRPWPPAQPANFNALDPANQDRYIWGYLRRNHPANTTYRYPVGGRPVDPDGRGIQGIDVTTSAAHWVRVRFDPTVQAPFNQPAYCRPPDNANRRYDPLNNGRWEIQPFSDHITTIIAGGPIGGPAVRMYNRRVSNGTTDGNCPAAGSNNGLPGGGDPYFPGGQYQTNYCYVGYNQGGAAPLSSPNNCQAATSGWDVSRSGFTSYNQNNTYFYATVITYNAPLPIEGIRLTAVPAGRAIALAWEIPQEPEYVLGYRLYRSTDGENFSFIAETDRQGRTLYRHTDTYVQPGVRYFYQVEQYDALGNIRRSNIAEATLSKESEGFSVQVSPNPLGTQGALVVSLPQAGPVELILYDAAGKRVAHETYSLSEGLHYIDLAPILNQLAAGTYSALLYYRGEAVSLRLLKLDPIR
ncbi:MAG: T9SS type A sorting domain-containing protein [Bacteroidia bacterium]